MKKLFLILLVILIFGCSQSVVNELPNIPPVVKIIEGNSTVNNGEMITLTTDITDPDNSIFLSKWSVNEIEIYNGDYFSFTARPEVMTDYNISVSVFDGTDYCNDSVIVTVYGAPWMPEPLNVYIFPEGVEMNNYTWVKHYIATDADNYSVVLNGAKTKVEEHNLFYPDDLWYYIGGGI